MPEDPFRLQRFVDAQEGIYEKALGELRSGRKQTHWMWFVFPQLDGLGRSSTARFYAIRHAGEAAAYLQHPKLGPRLVECCEAILAIQGKTAREIFGFPDELKLRSCATLFSALSPLDSVFTRVIARYFEAGSDRQTLELLRTGA